MLYENYNLMLSILGGSYFLKKKRTIHLTPNLSNPTDYISVFFCGPTEKKANNRKTSRSVFFGMNKLNEKTNQKD